MNATVKVLYIGAGYVGATSAMITAYKCPTVNVVCYDKNKELINRWKVGAKNIPLYGVSLPDNPLEIVIITCDIKDHILELYTKAKENGIVFSDNISECLHNCHIVFICVFDNDTHLD